jgi:leucyl-tRNA synthetase
MDLKAIERKWQQHWKETGTFEAEPAPGQKKYYVNFPYPYMNGFLHIGHAFSLMRVEILARYKRMTGHNVLFPFAFHCTGTPIVAAADRIRKGEESQIRILKDMGIPEEDIPAFADALHWTQFFPKEARADLEHLGIGVDWRRTFITTSLNPFYSKFIEWQFLRLREEGYVKTGEYPVVWCPVDNAPTGDHARLKGEGERPQEFVLLKFRIDLEEWTGWSIVNERLGVDDDQFGGSFLLAATLRPETVFGQTNLWVDPEGKYAVTVYSAAEEQDGEASGGSGAAGMKEIWILSEPAVDKLAGQKKDLERIGTITGAELIGNYGMAPAIHRRIPVLPSHFCKAEKGTGIVTSVPSDAPDDWMGVSDLQQDPEECRKYGLDPGMVQAIEPIPIIDTPEWGTNSAVKLCQENGIKNQFEREKLEKAKKAIYKQGFYSGKMTDECGEFAGRPVEEVKEKVKEMLLDSGKADLMYELTGEVVCRCLSPCQVNIVDNQWFISYSDPEWKTQVHEALDRMELFPEVSRKQFNHVVDWLNDWACTREFGLGTPLPWDTKWLIESLSDSTIYMAYYTISKYLENGVVSDPETLDYDFFDHIFRGNGDPTAIAEKVGITTEKLKEMRSEFQYWYPYDLRGSGKDLIQNHLTFSIFNHVAVWGIDQAPKGFTVNGWMMVAKEKMSKSTGNFYTLRQVIDTYGTDVVRLTLGQAGEGLDDPNWEMEFAEKGGKRIAQWIEFATENYVNGLESDGEKGDERELNEIDQWFLSRIHRHIADTREQMELMNFRSALKIGYFDLQNSFRRYMKRSLESPHPKLLNEFIEVQTLILAPYIPHMAEEIWERIGKREGAGSDVGTPGTEMVRSVVDAPYPETIDENISIEVERQEEYLIQTVEDIRKILKVTKMAATKMVLYTSAEWKYGVFRSVAEEGNFDVGVLMKSVMQDPELRKLGKDVNKFIVQLVKDRPTYAPGFDEFTMLSENIDFISQEFNCDVDVYRAEDEDRYDPQRKAGVAKPYKPGIFIE